MDNISRRKFIGVLGGTALATTALLSSCKKEEKTKMAATGASEQAYKRGYLPIEVPEIETTPCANCNACMPCPYGVNISGIFSHTNQHLKAKTLPIDKKAANYEQLRKDYLASLDKNIKKAAQPDHCIGCGQCVEQCPHEIFIPEEIQKIDLLNEYLRRQG